MTNNMQRLIDQLLSRDDIDLSKPATSAQINKVAMAVGVPLPIALAELWRRADRIDLPSMHGHIWGATEFLDADKEWRDYCVQAGLIPILDDHESNFLVATVRSPLTPRLIYVPHDGDRKILFRDFESWLTNLLVAMEEGEPADGFLRDARGDYDPQKSRTEDDYSAARALLQTNGKNSEWNDAIDLLDDSNLPEWEALLQTEHFIRRDVIKRLRQSKSPAIRQLLERDEQAFADFAVVVAEAARQAGLKVGEQSGTCLRINGHWMELEYFYYRRGISNALPRIIHWFQDLIVTRHPSHRPGNFFED